MDLIVGNAVICNISSSNSNSYFSSSETIVVKNAMESIPAHDRSVPKLILETFSRPSFLLLCHILFVSHQIIKCHTYYH